MRNLTFLLILACCAACERQEESPCFQSASDPTEARIPLDDLQVLEVHDLFDVYLVQDTVNEVVVHAGSNLIDDLEFHQENNRLHVYNHSKCRWLRNYNRIRLTFRLKNLSRVSLWYPCHVETPDTVKWPDLYVYSFAKVFEGRLLVDNLTLRFGVNFTCAGSCSLAGHTGKLIIMNRGVHHIFADSLTSVAADITNNARGDIHLGPAETLSAHIWESGNIYYKGDPEIVVRDLTSTGRLIGNGN